MIDLHSHTTCSDGTFSPIELIQEAYRVGVDTIAITDHDTVDGVEDAINEGQKLNITVIPGLEFSVTYNGGKLHMLGYFINHKDEKLCKTLQTLKEKRNQRNELICEKLQSNNINITINDVNKFADGTVGRPHIAMALIEKGCAASVKECFDKYFRNGQAGYVSAPRINEEEAIHAIHDAGGIAVLAHPYQLNLNNEELETKVKSLKGKGLDGIECYYSKHSNEQTAFYEELSVKYDLKRTGGSDFHGSVKPDIALGVGLGTLKIPVTIQSIAPQWYI